MVVLPDINYLTLFEAGQSVVFISKFAQLILFNNFNSFNLFNFKKLNCVILKLALQDN